VSPSLPVPFIKNLFLKEIISLKDVDIGERTAEYLLQKQLEDLVRSSIERAFNLVYDWVLHA
jgi:aminopeptidase C